MHIDPSALLALLAEQQARIGQLTAERDRYAQALAEASGRDAHMGFPGGNIPGDDGVRTDHGSGADSDRA